MVPEGTLEVSLRTSKQVQHRLSSEEVDNLVSLYRDGAKVTELAILFNIHRDTVSTILNRRGVIRRHSGIPPELLNQVVSAYKAGASLAVIGAQVSVDPGTVALALRKAAVSLRTRRGWSPTNAESHRQD